MGHTNQISTVAIHTWTVSNFDQIPIGCTNIQIWTDSVNAALVLLLMNVSILKTDFVLYVMQCRPIH